MDPLYDLNPIPGMLVNPRDNTAPTTGAQAVPFPDQVAPELQPVMAGMEAANAADMEEARQKNAEAMVRLEEKRAKEQAELTARQVAVNTAAAQIARARYDRQQQEDPNQKMNRFLQEQAGIKESMRAQSTRSATPGQKAPMMTYDIVSRTWTSAPTPDRSQATADRITDLQRMAGIDYTGKRAVAPIFETPQFKGTGTVAFVDTISDQVTPQQILENPALVTDYLKNNIPSFRGGVLQTYFDDMSKGYQEKAGAISNGIKGLESTEGVISFLGELPTGLNARYLNEDDPAKARIESVDQAFARFAAETDGFETIGGTPSREDFATVYSTIKERIDTGIMTAFGDEKVEMTPEEMAAAQRDLAKLDELAASIAEPIRQAREEELKDLTNGYASGVSDMLKNIEASVEKDALKALGDNRAPVVRSGDDILQSTSAPLSYGERQAIAASPRGDMVLLQYNERYSKVVSGLQSNMSQLVGEDGRINEKTLADYAANTREFDPAMVGDLKVAIRAMAITQNEAADKQAQFRRQEESFQMEKQRFQMTVDAKAIENSPMAKAVSGIAPAKEGETKPASTIPARLVSGGMTTQEVALQQSVTEYADQTGEQAYGDAIKRGVARSLIPDVDLTEIAGQAVTVEDDNTLAATISSSLENAYNAARTGGADIRQEMTASIAKGLLAGKSEAEQVYIINQVYDAADEYARNRVTEQASGIISEQSAAATRAVMDVADGIATQAVQSRETAFQPLFNSEAWQTASKASDSFAKESAQRKAASGDFLARYQGEIEDQMKMMTPAEAELTANKYGMYASVINTEKEAGLAAADKEFAEIIRDRDTYVEQAMILAGAESLRRRSVIEDAAAKGLLVAFDGKGQEYRFNQDAMGKQAYVDFTRASDEEKADVAASYAKRRDTRVELEGLETKEMANIKRGLVTIEQYGKSMARGGGMVQVPDRTITPEREEDWDNYMTRLERNFAGDPEIQARVMGAALKEKAKWEEGLVKKLVGAGLGEQQAREQIGAVSEASLRGKEKMYPWSMGGQLSAGRDTLKEVAKRSIATSLEAGDVQPLIPDTRFQQLADGVLVEGQGKIDTPAGFVAAFTADAKGNLTFINIPENIANDPTQRQQAMNDGVFFFGQ